MIKYFTDSKLSLAQNYHLLSEEIRQSVLGETQFFM